MMQADPHKLDFRSDLLARLPGAGGLGPLGPMGGALPPTHDLTRPPGLFSATGAYLNIYVSQEQVENFIVDRICCVSINPQALNCSHELKFSVATTDYLLFGILWQVN